MAGLKDLEDRIQKLEEAAERVREATTEANSATKAARETIRELHKVEEDVIKRVKEEIEERFGDLVREGLESYKGTLRQATNEGYDKVIAEFEKIKNIMMYGNEKGKGESIIEAWVAKAINEELIKIIKANPKLIDVMNRLK